MEVSQSHRLFVVETEPRDEQATARQMFMLLQKRHVFLLKRSGPMIQPLLIARLWRWELGLAIPPKNGQSLSLSSGFNIGARSLVLKIQ